MRLVARTQSARSSQSHVFFAVFAAFAFQCVLPAPASATWSVIAADRSTGRVVIASATCVDRDDQFLMGVQAVVVPGLGVAACQAGVDITHQNQMLVFRELQQGTDPKAIIELLSADPAFQTRQFGILDLRGRSAGHSGLTNGYVSQDIHGHVPGTEIFYSIQGNILRPGQVVPNAVQAFLNTKGAITDRVMAAMEAADGSGGDSRCTCPPWPTDGSKPAIPFLTSTFALAVLCSTLAVGQQRGGNPSGPPALPAPPGQPAPPAQSGQRGRGRGGVQVMTLVSVAWPDGGQIPAKHTQAGEEISPALSWSGVPEGAASFVLIVHDLEAATGNGTDDILQWMLWNVPAAATSVSEGVPRGSQLPDGTHQISATGPNYRGPGAPASGPAHHYVFELFALDTMLDVPAVGASPPQTRAAVVAAMAGHVRGKAAYVGLFKRR
jgi:hypothetical protein